MTLLFVSTSGKCLGLARRCATEGYKVNLHIENECCLSVGEGIVDKLSPYRRLLNRGGECIVTTANRLFDEVKPDLIIFEGNGMGKVADYARDENYSVFGNSYWSDCLSNRSGYADNILHRIGIEKWKGEDGVRVEVGMWWNGLRSLSPFIIFNEGRFMNDSLGPNINSAGNAIKMAEGKMIDESIQKIECLLKKTRFRGIISLSLVITKSKILAVSFTTSLLYLPSLLEIYKGSVSDLLLSTAESRKPEGKFTTDYALSIFLSIPPFPAVTASSPNIPLKGVSPSNLKHLYLMDVCRNGSGYESAGANGSLMWVSARGRTVGEAKKRVYKTISNISIPDIQYRTDIISENEVTKKEKKLVDWNFLSL